MAPIGNLGRDLVASVADIFFARSLEMNKHLLWCSSSSSPDLGQADVDPAAPILKVANHQMGAVGSSSMMKYYENNT